eukprot:scaffold6429_cov29-Attheya_sp.AAC.3
MRTRRYCILCTATNCSTDLDQSVVTQLILATTDKIDRKLIVLIGLGGTGKSTTVNAVITTLKQEREGWRDENYAVFATTGLAATNIHGSTVHSWKEGLGFLVGKAQFQPRSEKQLDQLQSKFKYKLQAIWWNYYCAGWRPWAVTAR